MSDFRAEALDIYNSTRSGDSNRGVIAALLHVADLLAEDKTAWQSASDASGVRSDTSEVGRRLKQAALACLRTRYKGRSATADKLARCLRGEEIEVTLQQVKLMMWDLHAQGLVEAHMNSRDQTWFSAITERPDP